MGFKHVDASALNRGGDPVESAGQATSRRSSSVRSVASSSAVSPLCTPYALILVVTFLLGAVICVACWAMPTYAWLSSNDELRSADFVTSSSGMAVSVQTVAGTRVPNQNAGVARNGIFTFDAQPGLEYEVAISANSDSAGYCVVAIDGMPKAYVTPVLALATAGQAAEATGRAPSVSFKVRLGVEGIGSENDPATGTETRAETEPDTAGETDVATRVTVTPFWGDLTDLGIAASVGMSFDDMPYAALHEGDVIGSAA